MATMQKVSIPPAPSTDGLAELRQQYGCGPVQFSGTDEAFYELDGPPVRITTPHIPLPASDVLEDMALPSVDRIVDRVRRSL